MHFLKPVSVLAALRYVLVDLVTGKILTFRTQLYTLFFAAFAHIAALAEFVVVGGNGMAAVTHDILGIKFPFLRGIFMG